MIWPANLAVLYPLPDEISRLALTASLAVLAGISVAVWLARKAVLVCSSAGFGFLGTLVPVIGLVQVGSQAMADRYTYFPLIGAFHRRRVRSTPTGQSPSDSKSHQPEAWSSVVLGACRHHHGKSIDLLAEITSRCLFTLWTQPGTTISPTSGLAWPFKTKAIQARHWPSTANPHA